MRNQALAGTAVAPGVHQIGPKFYRIDARRKDSRIKGPGRYRERLFRGPLSQAKRARAELVRELESQVEERKEAPFFGDYAATWLVSKEAEVSVITGERYADTMGLHLLPTLGKKKLDAITREDVKALMASLLRKEAMRSVRRLVMKDGERVSVVEKVPLGRKLSRTSVHSILRVLRNCWHEAQLEYPYLRDVTTKIKLGTPTLADPDECNSLTPAELGRFLLAWQGSRHEALVYLLCSSGLRFCHASALRWDDLDVDNLRVKVIRSHVLGRVSKPNTVKRAPGWVYLPALVVQKLLEHKARLDLERAPGRENMFPSAVGTLQTPGCMLNRWRKAARQAGILKRFSVHGARRTYIDLVRRAGASSIVSQAVAGHSNEAMTMHYSTVGADERAALASRIIDLVPVQVVAS
jgi:integrase